MNGLFLGSPDLKIWSRKYRFYCFFLLAIFLTGSNSLFAQATPLLIDKEKVSAARSVLYLSPDKSSLLIEDILPGADQNLAWQLNQATIPNFGFGPMSMWFWLPIHNPTDKALERLVEIQNPVLDEVVLYQVAPQDTLVSRQVSGDRYAMRERPAVHYNLLFSITVPPGETHHLYFKVMTDGAMQFPIYLWEEAAFYQADQIRLLGYGILFGVLVVMALYNLFAYMMLQDRVFLYYSGCALSLAVFEAAMNGFGNQYLWPDSPWWREHSVTLFVPVLVCFGSLFARSFLQLKLSYPFLYKAFGWFFHMAAITALASLFLSYSLTIRVSTILAVPVAIMAVTIGLYRWRKGYVPARYFVLAWAMFLLSVIAYAASKFGVLPESTVTEHSMQLGAMLGSIMSAFALTDRVNTQRLSYMEAQKNALLMQKKAKEDLEKTVAERTQKLQEALSQLENANEQLQSLSMLDGLTGIKNRRFFDEKIEREWSRAIRNDAFISLLAIDIDHFKQFNDNYGHLLGDECLKHVANVIQGCVSRPSDAVARYGGEEFMVILPETDQEGARYIAEEIRTAVETQSFEHEGETYRLTVSVGLSSVRPLYGTSYQVLISEADRALYQSKKNGRNQVTVF